MDDQGAGSINSCAGLVSICAECAGGLKMINELTNYVVNETTIRLEHDKANEIVTFLHELLRIRQFLNSPAIQRIPLTSK